MAGTQAQIRTAGQRAQLEARVGLETAGMRFPLARVGGEDDHPEDSGFPVIVGSDHYQALFALGIFLFSITFTVNLTADLVVRGIRKR